MKESVDFMLKEIDLLQKMAQHQTDLGEKRVNILISIITATLGFVFYKWTNGPDVNYFYTIIIILLTFNYILSFLTLLRMIKRQESIIQYKRGINRIRRYFVEKDNSIAEYLILPIYDNIPGLKLNVGSLLSSIILLASIIAGGIFWAISTKLGLGLTASILIGFAFGILNLIVKYFRVGKYLEAKGGEYVQFPKPIS